jgi:hypothetical protein
MKRSRKLFWIIILFCLIGIKGSSQDSVKYNKNYIGIGISQLLFNDYHLFYERRIYPKHSLKIEIGYKPQEKQISTNQKIINLDPKYIEWSYGNTVKSYYLSFEYRYYFNKNQTFYLSPELFYRRYENDKIVFIYGENRSNENLTTFDIRSINCDIGGLNLLAGKEIKITNSDKSNLGLNIFTGISFRYKELQTSIFGRTQIMHYFDESIDYTAITVSDSPIKTNEIFYQLFLQLGVELYFSCK